MTTALHEEEVQERTFSLRLTRRLVGYLRPHAARVLVAVVLIALTAVASQVGPYLTKVAVDEYILAGRLAGLYLIVALYIASFLVQFAAQFAQSMVTEMTGQLVMRDLRRQIFRHLQRLPVRYFDRTPLGRIMTRTTNDVEALNEFFTEGAVAVFLDLFTLLAIVAFMARMDLQLTLVACMVVPVLGVATFYLQGRAMVAYREVRLRLARLNAYLQENITGMEVVQLYNREARNLQDFDAEHRPYRRAEDRELHYYAVFFPFTELVSTVGMVAVLWYGAGAVAGGRVELGVLVAFLQYVGRFFRPIMDISDRYALLQSAMAASERIFDLLDTAPEPTGGPRRPVPADGGGGTIEFEHVHFRYDEAATDWVLRDVSFRVAPGQSLALVGATGSGKTTVVNLLCRFYEVQQGSIRVDGVDVRDWNVAQLRERIGVVQQDVFLFSGDIRGNICLGAADMADPTVEAAARHANAHGFIVRLPGGYGHPVGEAGATLSAGQRQLLAFARAIAAAPRILVLDEATASIDTDTEQLIQEAIGRLLHDRTAIVIAHRLSTIRAAEQILVLHRGEVRERGRHRDLLRQRGIYYRLHQLNYGGLRDQAPGPANTPGAHPGSSTRD